MAKSITSVYLSSKNITIAQGKSNPKTKQIEVTEHALAPMPEGAVVNGLIIDEESLFEAFTEAKARFNTFKNVVLTLDTTHIIYRLSVMPKVPKKEMVKLVRNEFINRDMSDKEYVYDYAVINAPMASNKQHLVLCCAIDKTISDTFDAFFKRAGIKLAGINFSINVMLQMLAGFTDLIHRENTFICTVDHYIVSIINLLANGDILFNRSRIISSENDPDYYNEIANIIYSYRQGRIATNRSEQTDTVYILDSNAYAPDDYFEPIKRLSFNQVFIGIKAMLTITGLIENDADKYLYNLCALSSHTVKDLNLVRYKQVKPFPKRAVTITVGVAIPVITGGIAALFLISIYMNIGITALKLADTQMQITALGGNASDYETLQAEAAALTEIFDQLAAHDQLVTDTPILKKAVVLDALEVFEDKAIITQLEFSADEGYVAFYCYLENADDITYYVGKLRETGIFSDIGYIGYGLKPGSVNDADGNAYDWYGYSVTCMLSEVKGDE